jgi:hypothetical protein
MRISFCYIGNNVKKEEEDPSFPLAYLKRKGGEGKYKVADCNIISIALKSNRERRREGENSEPK